MANKRISELTLRTPNTTDLMLIGDPTTGYSFKTTLSAVLANNVPYSGATANVNLGEFGLSSGYIAFDTTPTSTPTGVGTMSWDSFYGTPQIKLAGGNVSLQVGQEQVTLVHNNTGSTLTDGQVVYITGSTGELPTVALASNTSEATSSVTFGVVTEPIANGANGYITTSGMVHGLNTNAFTEGAAIWLGTGGAFTQTKPVAPANSVLIGYVVKKSGGNGSIFVKIQNGYELEELHNVSAQNPNDNDILQFKSSTGLWTKTAGTTTNISEGTNLYYTDARVRAAISLTTSGNSGAATYNSTTGVLNIPNYSNALSSYVPYSGASANVNLGSNYLIAQRFQSTGGELISVLLKGRSSDNKSQLQFYDNSGGNLYGYIESAPSGVNGSLNIVSGNSSIQLTNTYVSTTSLLVNTTTDNGSGAKLQVSGAATFSSSVTAGGNINLPNSFYLTGRNAANTLNILLIGRNASDRVIIDPEGYGTTIGGGGTLQFNGAATFSSSVTAGGTIESNSASPLIRSISTNPANDAVLGSYAINGTAIEVRYNPNSAISYIQNTYPAVSGQQFGDIQFRINSGGTMTPVMTVKANNQSVGIGTTNPSTAILHLNYNAINNRALRLQDQNGIFDFITSGAGQNHSFGLYDDTNAAYRLFVTSGGNVGIGTTSPDGTLVLAAGTNGTASVGGYLGFTTGVNNSKVRGAAIETFTTTTGNDHGLRFYTNDVATAPAERMRITSGGNVGINTSTGFSTYGSALIVRTIGGSNILQLDQTGTGSSYFAIFTNGNGAVGAIQTNGTSTTYTTTSDYRLKTDLKDFAGVDLVNSLKVYDYKWLSDNSRSYGVLAHELQSVLPYAVTGVKDGEKMQGVDYSKIVPILIKAIQELKSELNTLKK